MTTLNYAVQQVIDNLNTEHPWDGATIVKADDGDFDAIPTAWLSDISYNGSRTVVAQWGDVYDMIGDDSPETDYDAVVDFWTASLKGVNA